MVFSARTIVEIDPGGCLVCCNGVESIFLAGLGKWQQTLSIPHSQMLKTVPPSAYQYNVSHLNSSTLKDTEGLYFEMYFDKRMSNGSTHPTSYDNV